MICIKLSATLGQLALGFGARLSALLKSALRLALTVVWVAVPAYAQQAQQAPQPKLPTVALSAGMHNIVAEVAGL